jgi:flagellar FliJ protein
MARFHYPFQRILELKEKEKENSQLQMAKAIRRQEKVEVRLSELQANMYQAQSQLTMKQEQGISIIEIRMLEDYIEHLRRRLSLEHTEFKFAKKNVEKKQEVLLEKLKEEKTWIVLKEKQEQEFFHQSKIQEQLQLDEMATTSFYRRSALKG